MIPLRLREVAEATGGSLHDAADPDALVTGPVVVDSRLASAGSLFVAVKGERADGHDHAAAAVAGGAAGVLAARPVGMPAVVVDDPVAALGRLARAVLDRLDGLTVIGITGSSGKTGTKDLLAQVLETVAPTVAPEGSFNTEIGVPLTALRAARDTRHLVVEMGARGAGHIDYLCRVAPPRVGVVLNVGHAHAGEFGGMAATARAKSELVRCLPDGTSGGVAILNADDPLVAAMAGATAARVRTFGRSAGADVRADDVALDARGRASFRLVVGPEARQSEPVTLRSYGAHQVSGALAVATAALELGVELPAVAVALGAATARSRWRMEVTERADGVTVVNDAYNANPDSMRAGLEAVAAMVPAAAHPRPRVWAVLGEMLELGAASDAEHERVGRLARSLHVDRLVVVGERARGIHAGAVGEGARDGEESVVVADSEAAHALLRDELRPGDVVLFKSSRDAGLRWLGDRVAGLAPACGEPAGGEGRP